MNFSKINLNLNELNPILPIFTGHSQTILGHIVPSASSGLNYKEHILTLEDGDEVLLEYVDNKSDTTISLYHGLAGNSNADYIQRSAKLAAGLGWNIILVNHRSAHVKARANRTYHSGRGEDASDILKWSKKKFKGSRQVAVGFSMSGSILLNLLTKRFGSELPDYAIVVNAPLQLAKASKYLSQGLSKLYDYRFYLALKRMINERESIKLPLLGRTFDIDESYTSKVNGFRDAADYYESCSTWYYLNRIQTKTFILTSHDDPFIDVNDYLSASWSASTHLTLQKFGGHMGYFDKNKNPYYGHRWLDHYLSVVFNIIKKN